MGETTRLFEDAMRVFHEVCDRSAEERATELDRLCEGRPELREEVEALLMAHESPTGVLDEPLLDPTSVSAADGSAPRVRSVDTRDWFRPTQIGRYRILDVLGEGGMGIVYSAEQDTPHRRVALKVIRPGFVTDSMVRRLQNEAEILGWLQHPGVAQVFDAGTEETPQGSLPYFVMELVDGRPLKQFVAEEGLGLRQRLSLFAEICDAVHHAHQKGVIHRDLKPGNILIDESGQPKVLDFGVAKVVRAENSSTTWQTDPGQVIGTLAYMSPEQIEGDQRQVDVRSDVYSLGVLLYELVTERLPYDLKEAALPRAARIVCEDLPIPPSSIRRECRGDLEAIISRALRKEPDRRYSGASALGHDIQRYLNDEPILARPTSVRYVVWKLAKRHKVTLTAAAVAAIGIWASVVVALVYVERANAAERLAESDRLALRVTTSIPITYPQKVTPDDRKKILELEEQLGQLAETNPLFAADSFARAGKILHDAGELEVASRFFRRAAELRASRLDADDLRVIDARMELSRALWAMRRLDEAQEALPEVDPPTDRSTDERVIAFATARRVAALILQARGKHDEAEVLFKLALDTCRNHLEPGHEMVHRLEIDIAEGWLVRADHGRFDDAETVFRRLLKPDVRRELDSADEVRAVNGVTSALLFRGTTRPEGETALEEAIAWADAGIRLVEFVVGEPTDDSLSIRTNKAIALVSLGRSEEALPDMWHVYEARLESVGAHDVRALRIATLLLMALKNCDQVEEAAEFGAEAIERAEAASDQFLFGNLLHEHGATLQRLSRFEEARVALDRALPIYEQALSATHVQTVDLAKRLATVLDELGEPDEAAGIRELFGVE